jgi:formylglycine-generating enzyme required for sulfatase activity
VRQRLRWIPPGRFLMGSPEGEEGRFENEGPQREVAITPGYWTFDTPCTQALWEAVMPMNPSRFQSPTRPVEQVSWHDCQEFVKRLNARLDGLVLSLPSEAQWEYACRAGTSTATYAGDLKILGQRNAPMLDAIAWYAGNCGVGFELENGYDATEWPEKQHDFSQGGTRPVGLKEPNAWGLYDMLGNVWEWCADAYRSYGAGKGEASAHRVVRGGAWGSAPLYVRAAYRDLYGATDRGGYLGFRCAEFREGQVVSQGRAANEPERVAEPRAGREAARPGRPWSWLFLRNR